MQSEWLFPQFYGMLDSMKSWLHRTDITLQPLRDDIHRTTWESLRSDLYAGFNVALITMPQVMAYALITGLPLTCGLFASIFGTIVAALLGSSRHLIVGPTNTIGILVQAGTAEILFTYYRDAAPAMREMLALQILAQLTFLVAVLQVLAAIAGFGRLTQFVSHSVVVGYMIGTSIALVASQIFLFLGMPAPEVPLAVYQKFAYAFTHLGNIHWITLAVGVSSLAFLVVMKKQTTRIPAAAITILGFAAFFYFLRETPGHAAAIDQVRVVSDLGILSGVVPQLQMPYLDLTLLNKLFPVALAIALLGMLESSMIGKSLAVKSTQRLSINQEVFGLGMGNLASALVGAMPGSGSASRSAENFNSGAQSRFAAVFSGCFVSLMIFALGHFMGFIPLAVFSALLFVTAFSLIDYDQFKFCLRSSSTDAFVLGVTILSCLIFSVDIAFYIGMGLSITFYLNKASTPYLVEHMVNEAGDLRGGEQPGATRDRQIRIVSVQGELFFGAAELLQNTLRALTEGDSQTRVLILRLKHARDLDATACLALSHLHRHLQQTGRYLVGCSITLPVWEILCNSGVADEIGRENLFLFDPTDPQQSVRRAWQRASELSTDESLGEVQKDGQVTETIPG